MKTNVQGLNAALKETKNDTTKEPWLDTDSYEDSSDSFEFDIPKID